MKIELLVSVLIGYCSLISCDEEVAQLEQIAQHENFKRLFQEKRLYQLGAVKQLQTLEPEKQTKLLEAMIIKMMAVLTRSKTTLIDGGY